ncbi:hypothetical protein H9Q72_004105 [Fusarium xylarioides]|uniref:Uncharacterized protein n=1 Tax=Fusarium xylarioides TaxID=221167 RepID=A0A9P7HYJ0_9HYPO|nr:hypothetical protein H9Q72_004105 [Fusarium xylarioides]
MGATPVALINGQLCESTSSGSGLFRMHSADWIITATSSPIGSNPDALVEEILMALSKQQDSGGPDTQVESVDKLASLIIDHCIGSYDRRPSGDSLLSIAHAFSHFINRIGRNGTSLFQELRAWSSDGSSRRSKERKQMRTQLRNDARYAVSRDGGENILATSGTSNGQTRARTQDTEGDDIGEAIQKAKDLHCDIHDVRDEINILKSVAQYQQMIQKGRASKLAEDSSLSSTYVLKDLQELDCTAERIQSAINTTLAFQQSEVANRQATEATRQGKTVMTFTFATVLFLPLSFLSSLFALDVASFQEAPAWAFYIICES